MKSTIYSKISYKLIREIGKGSFAHVYLARRVGEGLDRYVAVKVIDVRKMNEKQRTAIMDEVKITGALTHQNIIHVYDCGMIENNYFFIVSELVQGNSLREVIRKHTMKFREKMKSEIDIPLSLMKHAAGCIFMNVAFGLEYIHCARDIVTNEDISVIHSDLKPGNILLGKNGSVKISDFGISYSPIRSVRLKGGTPAYMAPEWIDVLLDDDSTESPNVPQDIFSFGVCLHETLTDRRLFKVMETGLEREDMLKTLKHQMLDFKFGTTLKVNPAAEKNLCAIVDKCLESKPENRYKNMREIISEFDALIEQGIFHPEIMDRRFLAEYMNNLGD